MADIVGIKKRRVKFFLVANSVIDDERLSGKAVLVYIALSRIAGTDGECYPSLETIGKKARLKSRTAILGAIQELVKCEYLVKVSYGHKGSTNVYELSDVFEYGTVQEMDSDCPQNGHDEDSSTKKNDKREGSSKIRPTRSVPHKRTSSKIRETLELYHDNPDQWVRENKDAIQRILKEDGERKLLGALKVCLDTRPDKLRFFADDYIGYLVTWKKREEERLEENRIETEGTRHSREIEERRRIKAETYDPNAHIGRPWETKKAQKVA